jgi:hypothetical protein
MPKAFKSFDQAAAGATAEKPSRHISRRSIIAVTAAVLLGSVTVLGMTKRNPFVDESTGCLVEVPPPSTLAIMMDASDPIAANEVSRAKATVGGELKRLPEYSQVIVAQLNAKMPNDPTVMVASCSPGSGSASDFVTGSVFAKRSFHDKIEAPVLKAIDDIAAKATATVSPIQESITALTRRSDFDGSVRNRQLILITDGLQNDRMPARTGQPRYSKGYTHYSGEDPWKAFQRSSLATRPGPDLRNTSVIIQYIERPEWTAFQNLRHRAFWERWLRMYGATQIEFRGIPFTPLS